MSRLRGSVLVHLAAPDNRDATFALPLLPTNVVRIATNLPTIFGESPSF